VSVCVCRVRCKPVGLPHDRANIVDCVNEIAEDKTLFSKRQQATSMKKGLRDGETDARP